MEETSTSILQVVRGVSNQRCHNQVFFLGDKMPRKPSSGVTNAAAKTSSSKNNKSAEITQMRVLAHDLSNALEAILQASYLLGQSKLNEDPRRWAQLIDSSSQEAARLNREIRKLLRALSDE